MSAIADITVYDGATTPAAHVFKPVDVAREKGKVTAEWRESVSGVPLVAQGRISTTVSKLSSGVFKAETRVAIPVMEAVSGQNSAGYTAAPKVAYENTVVITGFFHERSSQSDRRLVRQMAANLLSNVSTSVAASTAGPVPELIDLLISST